MAGALSGHLIDSLESPIVSSGNVSFNPQMHGTPYANAANQSFSFGISQPFFANDSISDDTILKIAALQAKLDQKLGPEYISQRPGPGGGPKLTYAEGWRIINLANEVFGFNGWSTTVVNLTTDFIDYNEESKRYNVGASAIVRVTLRDGVFHEDIGYGMLENSKSKGGALDKCKKEAVTDGMKRALRSFGNLLGNCLYDKSYTQEVVKIKVPPAKFNQEQLHRRPEFQDTKPNISLTSHIAPSTNANYPRPPHNFNQANATTPTRPPVQQQPQIHQPMKPISSIPLHMRSELPVAGPSSRMAAPPKRYQQLMSRSAAPGPAPQQKQSEQPKPPQVDRKVTFDIVEPHRYPEATTFKQLPAPAPVPTRVVPKAEKTDDDGEESFTFFSDDDAFLAAVDLGEGDLGRPIGNTDLERDPDMGRPIQEDADIGRPIDFESGSKESGEELTKRSGTGVGIGTTGKDPGPQQHQQSRKIDGRSASLSRREQINAALAQQAEAESSRQMHTATAVSAGPSGAGAGAAAGMLSRLLPNHQQQQRSLATTTPTSNQGRVGSNIMSGQHQSAQDQSFRPPLHHSSNQIQNQNRNPDRQFNSMNQQGHSEELGSGVGMKRPAEAMGSNSGYRSSRPGMGLQQASGQGQPKREILGRLDVGEGGDVKRVRR